MGWHHVNNNHGPYISRVWLSLFQDSKLLVLRYLLSIACLCRELLRCLGPWPKGRKHSSSKQCWIASYACALQPANLDTPVSDSFITLKCTMTKACEPCKQHQRVKAHKAHQRSGPPHWQTEVQELEESSSSSSSGQSFERNTEEGVCRYACFADDLAGMDFTHSMFSSIPFGLWCVACEFAARFQNGEAFEGLFVNCGLTKPCRRRKSQCTERP